ncbi:hypothetical protein ACQEU8_09135 [Streptomyces sp. CA-250714]|uniref:hypothetical protein n=1 Tax=Streptomyces sp. CA-250714 TaxID=3240060 RepID=UPI003D8DCBDA
MVGEDAHFKGISGAKRAKLYLEGTMRISGAFANTDSGAWVRKLTLAWPEGGQTSSFDLGGSMRGAPYHGDQFCAEVKHYQGPKDLEALPPSGVPVRYNFSTRTASVKLPRGSAPLLELMNTSIRLFTYLSRAEEERLVEMIPPGGPTLHAGIGYDMPGRESPAD